MEDLFLKILFSETRERALNSDLPQLVAAAEAVEGEAGIPLLQVPPVQLPARPAVVAVGEEAVARRRGRPRAGSALRAAGLPKIHHLTDFLHLWSSCLRRGFI